MLDADEAAAINADTDISNEAIGQLIGPAARFKCDMRFGVPFENERLELVHEVSIRKSKMLLALASFADNDASLFGLCIAALHQEELDAAYISWYGREGTP